MKTIEIDGVLYNLTPANETSKEVEETITNTFYYGACSDDGKFEFCVLLNEENKIWEGTQSVTYLPDTDKQEIWDNSDYLKAILSGKNKCEDVEISDSDFSTLKNLLEGVRKRGWI
tara:strand:- start:2098 stop:2445 length:348 start_codon:yes stop_codon:yes gene_type:complete